MIKAIPIHRDARVEALPKHFGRHMLLAESAVFDFMSQLAEDYGGGFWDFYELSNGGFYMAPATSHSMKLLCEGNGAEATLSADAAGIVACLFAYSHLSFRHEAFSQHFLNLRAFAVEHPEADAILRLID